MEEDGEGSRGASFPDSLRREISRSRSSSAATTESGGLDDEAEGVDGGKGPSEVASTASSSSDSDHLSSRAGSMPASPERSLATNPSPQRKQEKSQALPHGHDVPSAPFKLCVECEDQSAEVSCIDCLEDFCRPCFSSQHRRGKRSEHRVQAILGEMMEAPTVPTSTEGTGVVIIQQAPGPKEDDMMVDGGGALENGDAGSQPIPPALSEMLVDRPAEAGTVEEEYEQLVQRAGEVYDEKYMKQFRERCRHTPMRLTEQERTWLRVLESALNVSEYTDNVDTTNRYRPKSERILAELELVLRTILGLMICSNPTHGEQLVENKLPENAEFFQSIFEVGRRYKIMNPEKMRGTYGKLMYLLQDTQSRLVQGQVGFCCVKDVVTVFSFLEERESLDLLEDPRILIATRDITDKNGKRSREQVALDVQMKQMAAAQLQQRFARPNLTNDDIQRVLDSVADSNNYLNFNVGPVRRMLSHLRSNFSPESPENGFSLAIGGGGRSRFSYSGRSSFMYGSGYGSSYFRTDSAKLSHDHSTHYTYVNQSLRLWKDIMQNMYKLWYKADQDLLSTASGYTLANTGQGLNRVQACPKVGGEMRAILGSVQRDCGAWVGLSVVHLGDRDVPNALMFIDKYTQVPRILSPVARTIEHCAGLFDNDALRSYAEDVWDSPENLKMHVLVDFFKHGFDGDGDDGGSCIDGRLTSAWNWCSKIVKKPYYFAFMLAGFEGFDGRWRD